VVIEVGTLNRGDAVGGLEVIGPPSMADAAPAPRAHAQAPVRARKPISLIFEVPPAEGTPTLSLNSQDFGTSR
jgi:hypothetical protein